MLFLDLIQEGNLGLIEAYANRCVRIPMREGLRSLNLSNAVAVAAYEALRLSLIHI